jgi:mono/diheme cytochrome c family protein
VKNRLFANYAIALGFLAALASCAKNPHETGFEYIPDMVKPYAYEAYSESTLTKDGKSMMRPVANTIPRGYEPYPYTPGPEGAAEAGLKLKSPLKSTEENLTKGKRLFGLYCIHCHGELGLGNGPVAQKFPPPPAYNTAPVNAYAEGRIYHVITTGSAIMPSHAVQMNPTERWQVVQYVQKLQKQGP